MELTDRMVDKGFGDHVALIGNGRRRTYKELADWTNRLAHAPAEDFGVKPGRRRAMGLEVSGGSPEDLEEGQAAPRPLLSSPLSCAARSALMRASTISSSSPCITRSSL